MSIGKGWNMAMIARSPIRVIILVSFNPDY